VFVKRYIDSVIILCVKIKTNSRASSEWAQCIAHAHKYKMELESKELTTSGLGDS
jgi:hypothetical protein